MIAPGETTFTMLSGAKIDLLAPDWREIQLSDIAYGMAAIRRWNGQARRQISDAEHSGRVADLVAPRFRLAAELHDAQEPAFGDWIKPAVNALIALAGESVAFAIDTIKFRLDVAITRRVLASFGPARYEASEEAEAFLLAQEMRSPEVRRADELAAEIEDRARGVWGCVDPIDLPRQLPEISAATAWLERVKQACVERYGATNGS